MKGLQILARSTLRSCSQTVVKPTMCSGFSTSSGGKKSAFPEELEHLAGMDPNFVENYMNDPMAKEAMAGIGGAAGLTKLMQDPKMMSMVYDTMMKRPDLSQILDRMGGSAGFQQMMKDPAIMSMATELASDPRKMSEAFNAMRKNTEAKK